MNNKVLGIPVLALAVVISCNAPSPGGAGAPVPSLTQNPPVAPMGIETGTPTPYSPPASPASAEELPSSADLPFHIDCTALDPSRQPDCDAYIAATRERVYPLLRELTGTSLSSCYDAVYYTIVTNAQLSEYQGQADKNRITYSLRASLDAAPAPLYDAHELLHTINFCNGALDHHVFHGAFESYIDLALTGIEWQSPGRANIVDWLETKLVPGLQTLGNATPVPGAGGGASFDACVEIYGDLVTILYYDSGIETIKQIYRATINPGPEYTPNPRLLTLFGPSTGRQFQVVVNALKQNPKYQLSIPECGY